ncbi:MAG TPA: Fe-S-containing protein [Thermoanaerobaculia bacterium]|nr:Fe-S-containing protein [Thermoanaerobaculia bacterium]
MRRFKPVHGILIVVLFLGVVWGAETVLEGRLNPSGFQKVSPDREGQVHVDLAGLKPNDVRFYQFLNSSNQEVQFFVAKDGKGEVQVAFNANETCAKSKRGFRHEGEWMVCNKCDKAFRISEIHAGGEGCTPVPVRHQILGSELVLAQNDVISGWRLFH